MSAEGLSISWQVRMPCEFFGTHQVTPENAEGFIGNVAIGDAMRVCRPRHFR